VHRQNKREQNKFDDVFACTVETREKELERCHLLDRKDHQHVSVDPPRHQPTDARQYFSAFAISQLADHRIIGLQCPGFVRYQELEAVC